MCRPIEGSLRLHEAQGERESEWYAVGLGKLGTSDYRVRLACGDQVMLHRPRTFDEALNLWVRFWAGECDQRG